jgi:mycothiol system anti-sigma-R factor
VSQIPCDNCRQSLALFIDNEIDDSATFNEIAFHLQECDECRNQLETERRALNLIRTLLSRSCCETAPSTLQERIAHQLHELQLQELAGYTQTEIITQYRRTEITIDGETQIEIETSHEIRRDFPF